MKKRGRALALLLAAVLTVSSVPGTVMAADGVKPQNERTAILEWNGRKYKV